MRLERAVCTQASVECPREVGESKDAAEEAVCREVGGGVTSCCHLSAHLKPLPSNSKGTTLRSGGFSLWLGRHSKQEAWWAQGVEGQGTGEGDGSEAALACRHLLAGTGQSGRQEGPR